MKKLNQSGQSTIEFIFCFSFGVCIILMVFNTAMNYTTGYLVHYATFMASRHYLTNESFGGNVSLVEAEEAAKRSFANYQLGIFSVPNDALKFNPPGGSPEEHLKVGTYAVFKKRVDPIGQITGQSEMTLVSESFLGKEPTRAVCASRTCKAITGRDTCDKSMDITLFDDGC